MTNLLYYMYAFVMTENGRMKRCMHFLKRSIFDKMSLIR